MDIRCLDRDRLSDLSRHLRSGVVACGTALTVLLAIGIAGCSVNRALGPSSYTVERGDTLFGIAQSYGIDWHNLARWNHVDPPYRLHVGQQLTLTPYPQLDYAHMSTQSSGSNTGQASSGAQNRSRRTSGRGPMQPTVKRNATSTGAAASASNDGSPPNADSGGHTASGAAQSQTKDEETSIDSASNSAATRQAPVMAGGPSADGWQWPASGSLLRGYDPSARRRGIEIGGKVGAPIYAASSGTVVYNGSGLKGYGKLIIIKHDEHYLSAYGFIEKSQVKQGQTIAAGAQIAEMGRGPGNKPMLHFEIRKNGDPVDPEKLLPSR